MNQTGMTPCHAGFFYLGGIDMTPQEQLQKWISESDNIVFFGGAGVSTESGIKDFRSVDGLYHETYDYPPETILSHTFFTQKPDEFYRFYRDKMICPNVKPNPAHLKLAELERAGKLKAVVTQNIDGLHQAAGSRTVYELHGSTHRNYCMKCRQFYDLDFIDRAKGVPYCTVCGGMIKPDVVLYEESLPGEVLEKSIRAIQKADLLIVAGTSLTVYPAASLVHYYRGNRLVLINRDETPYDRYADLVFHESMGQIFENLP